MSLAETVLVLFAAGCSFGTCLIVASAHSTLSSRKLIELDNGPKGQGRMKQ